MTEKKSMLKRVKELEKGHTIVVPFGTYAYITLRGYASTVGMELDRKYSCEVDRRKRRFIITRHS